MLIALDYDGTYTADPVLWEDFICIAKARGHEVVVATMRYPSESIALVDDTVRVVYTSRCAKRPALLELGLLVAIWIDDNPHWINQDAAW